MAGIDEVELLEFVRDHPLLRAKVLAVLGVDPQGPFPIDVPLHEFGFRRATLVVHLDPDDDSSVEQTVELFAVKAPDAAVGRGADGRLFLIRKGDWVLRSTDGDYGLLRTSGEG